MARHVRAPLGYPWLAERHLPQRWSGIRQFATTRQIRPQQAALSGRHRVEITAMPPLVVGFGTWDGALQTR